MITPHSVITIREVANGYIVEPPRYPPSPCAVASVIDEDTMVFQDLEALEVFLREHFKKQPNAWRKYGEEAKGA